MVSRQKSLLKEDGKDVVINAGGNGRLDAVSNALANAFWKAM